MCYNTKYPYSMPSEKFFVPRKNVQSLKNRTSQSQGLDVLSLHHNPFGVIEVTLYYALSTILNFLSSGKNREENVGALPTELQVQCAQ